MSEQVPTAALDHCSICHRIDRDDRYHDGCENRPDHHCGNCHRAKCIPSGDRITCEGCDFQGVEADFSEYKKEVIPGVFDTAKQCPKCSARFDYVYGDYKP